jgi:hypothetical protein
VVAQPVDWLPGFHGAAPIHIPTSLASNNPPISLSLRKSNATMENHHDSQQHQPFVVLDRSVPSKVVKQPSLHVTLCRYENAKLSDRELGSTAGLIEAVMLLINAKLPEFITPVPLPSDMPQALLASRRRVQVPR